MSLFARTKSFIAEMKRRKVFHVGSIYLITAWGASLGAAELFPAFGIPEWAVRAFVLTAALGFPLALIMAWAFEITPDGVIRDPGKPAQPQTADAAPMAAEEGATTTWAHSSFVIVKWHDDQGSQTRQLASDFSIGRSADADVQIREKKISRIHARVCFEAGTWLLKDMGSRNGTVLNGSRINSSAPLAADNAVVLFEGGPVIELRIAPTEDETQIA
ncbi:MAG: FHA domain-containing protein [Pseudomonadales bacterium]